MAGGWPHSNQLGKALDPEFSASGACGGCRTERMGWRTQGRCVVGFEELSYLVTVKQYMIEALLGTLALAFVHLGLATATLACKYCCSGPLFRT